MLGLLEDKKNDDALLEAANFLQSTMRTHLGNTPATAEHEAAAVNDQGKFFAAEAVRKADQTIQEIYREYREDLMINTVAAVPPELQQQYERQGKQQFFEQWAAPGSRRGSSRRVCLALEAAQAPSN